jgi:peptidoglycan/xylan/chitin deacetylase (PgdA/CDA1 family)
MDRRDFIRTALLSLPGFYFLDGAAAVSTGIPILVFHRIGEQKKPYSLSPGQFEKILEAARDGGFFPVSLDEIVGDDLVAVPPGKKPFSITFDDGHPSQIRLKEGNLDETCAFSIMKRIFDDPRATFFVSAGTTGKKPFGPDGEKKIGILREAGMFLGSHTAGHLKMNALSTQEVIEQMGETMLYLDGVLTGDLAQKSVFLAYPYGVLPAGKKSRDAVKTFEYKGRTFHHPAAFSCRLGFGEPMTKKGDALLCPLPGTGAFESLRYDLPRIIISSLKDFAKDVAGRKEVYVLGEEPVPGTI